jgi:hypothetical protein
VSFGESADARAQDATAIGYNSIAQGSFSLALGNAASCAALTNAVALGNGATATANSQCRIGGTAGAQILNITTSGTYTTNNSTASTSTTTGSIVTSGGLGMAGDIFVGGRVKAGANISTSPPYSYTDVGHLFYANVVGATLTTGAGFVTTKTDNTGGNIYSAVFDTYFSGVSGDPQVRALYARIESSFLVGPTKEVVCFIAQAASGAQSAVADGTAFAQNPGPNSSRYGRIGAKLICVGSATGNPHHLAGVYTAITGAAATEWAVGGYFPAPTGGSVENLSVWAGGAILCQAAIASTSTATGSIRVLGGIGVTGSAYVGDLTATGNATLPTAPHTNRVRVIAADSGIAGAYLDSFGLPAVAYSIVSGRHARGTAATPAAVQAGDPLLRLAGYGYGASLYPAGARVYIDMLAAETWTNTQTGTRLAFFTTAPGGAVTSEKVRIWGDGGVQIGGTFTASTGAGTLYANGAIRTDDALLIGPDATVGSWRIKVSGTDLIIDRYEGGSWITKTTVAA